MNWTMLPWRKFIIISISIRISFTRRGFRSHSSVSICPSQHTRPARQRRHMVRAQAEEATIRLGDVSGVMNTFVSIPRSSHPP
jgi:hypothetical protein